MGTASSGNRIADVEVLRSSPAPARRTVLLLGAFPPQCQGIPGYCGALAVALSQHVSVNGLGFKAMYPPWLFPGEKRAMDPTAPRPEGPELAIRHVLTWYNPLAWCWHAVTSPATLFHLQWWSLPLFPVCLCFAGIGRLRRIPVVVTAHNVLPHEGNPWFVRASRILYRLADHVVVHSEKNRGQLLDTFDLDGTRLSHIPMGIKAATDQLPDKGAARAFLEISPDRPTLLFFGIIRPYKGVALLLRALAIIRKSHPEVLLVIAGKPWEGRDSYDAIISELGLAQNVDLHLDYIPESDVPHFYAAADLVVLPYTHFDAQSAVGVQALGYEKPVLVTNTGGLPDLVGGDRRWCVPPEDFVALAEALSAFLDDPTRAREAFAALLATHHMNGTWEESAQRHNAIYEGLWSES